MNNLKKLRELKKLTIRELGEAVNINHSTISNIENGRTSLNDQYIKIFTEFFNVSADYLLGLPTEAIPMTSGIFKPVKILGSVYAGYPTESKEEHLGYLMAKVDDAEGYFYLEVKGDSMSPTFESGDYVLVKNEKNYNNNDIVVAGLNGFEATVKRYRKIGDDCFLFADNKEYEPIKLSEEQEPYVVGVVKGFYRNTMN